jgi:uncharacterized protein
LQVGFTDTYVNITEGFGGIGMLEIRPNCECCDCDLPNGSELARICTFECTFCADCVDTRLGGRCPNCTGDLMPRPTRPEAFLDQYPVSTRRVIKLS